MSAYLNYLTKFIPGFSLMNSIVKESMINILKTGPVPTHLSFVMDGNRRFAKGRGLPLKEGHRMGADALMEVLDCCFRIGVKNVTTYAFSIENFNRPPEEIDTIFSLLKSKLAYISMDNNFCDLHKIRIKIVGNKTFVPPDVLADIEEVERKTSINDQHTLFVAFPYTSRDDIWHSVATITEKISEGTLDIEDIDQQLIEHNFYYEDIADKVDILVRTSGHTRLSDFMLWQCHQDSVIEYPNTLWPNYRFYSTWWTIFKWSFYKTLIIEDAEVMQIKKLSREEVNKRYSASTINHPPFASVTKVI